MSIDIHCNYFFFAAINGFLPKRLAHHLVHNRTANTWGIPGSNVALDLLCEHSNNEFKGIITHSLGKKGTNQVTKSPYVHTFTNNHLKDIFSIHA